MPNDFPRSHRVADFIQRELAELIRTEIKDPRVSSMVTVSSVEVSRDLGTAKVHYTIMGAQPGERDATDNALKRAAGFLRRQLSQRMNIRSVPELRFYYDDSIERGASMSALIDQAVASNTTQADSVDESDDVAENEADSENPISNPNSTDGMNGPA